MFTKARVYIFIISFIVAKSAGNNHNSSKLLYDYQCVSVGACFCTTNNQKMVDLRNLAEYVRKYSPDGFLKSKDPHFSSRTYFYNPCLTFDNGGCKDVYICLKENDHETDIGSNEMLSPSFNVENGILQVVYRSKSTSAVAAVSQVQCLCDLSVDGMPIFVARGAQPPTDTIFVFQLKHACCCPDGCQNLLDEKGLSWGSVLLIVFFTGAVFYLVFGALMARRVYGAKGWDMLPNMSFWTSYPGLVWAGIKFVGARCTERTAYERM